MRSQDLIDERTVAEARLRSLTIPARRRPRPIAALQNTPGAQNASAPPNNRGAQNVPPLRGTPGAENVSTFPGTPDALNASPLTNTTPALQQPPSGRLPAHAPALQAEPQAKAAQQDHPQPATPTAPSIRTPSRRHPYTRATDQAATDQAATDQPAAHSADVHPVDIAPSDAAPHEVHDVHGVHDVHQAQAGTHAHRDVHFSNAVPDDSRPLNADRSHPHPHVAHPGIANPRDTNPTDRRSLTATSWDALTDNGHARDTHAHVPHVLDTHAHDPHPHPHRYPHAHDIAIPNSHPQSTYALIPHAADTETLGDEMTTATPDPLAPPPPLAPRLPPSFEAFRAAVSAKAPALDPGRPGLRVLPLLAVLAALAAGVFLWRSEPTPEPLPVASPAPQVSRPAPPHSPTPTAEVTVHITGKVRKPGMYTLPMGARVADAVKAAGGVRQPAAAASVNLARRLVDGEQITVGAPGSGNAPAPPLADPAATILDLNTATPDQLEQLPGVGEVLAARIAEFRTAHGGFTSVAQLQEVPGIGAKKYEEIKDKVRI
ncbi:helix-hairpin-helix domain-containing protein [Nonomuraea sp. NPDC050691]|uniref:helix-hairpin-helix domain-containing protein n=1 Tax=Nonomuraea sp. NPDC050691 TaxID=3155661 RepID=UPI0033C070F3